MGHCSFASLFQDAELPDGRQDDVARFDVLSPIEVAHRYGGIGDEALRGSSLSDSDRSTLDADHLFLLSLRKAIQLTATEKEKIGPDHIFVLAMRGAIRLTAENKKALPDDHLFMLALRGIAHLTAQDMQRLPADDLTHLQMRGPA